MPFWKKLFQRGVTFGNCDTKLAANLSVVHFCSRSVLNGHFGNIGLALEYLSGHFTGLAAKLIVADRQCGDATACADAALTRDDRNLALSDNVANCGFAGGGGVVCRDLVHITLHCGSGCNGRDIVGVAE